MPGPGPIRQVYTGPIVVTCEDCGEAETVEQTSGGLGDVDLDPEVCPSCGGEWDRESAEPG